jgi:phosphatidylinositol alpha-1,6-mannosyltransferase
VFVHGLDLVVDHPLYQSLFLPSIRVADAIVANSRHTADLAAARGVSQDRIHVVNPGVELPAERADGAAFRERHGLGRRPILLSVGRLVARKGIAEFVERSFQSVLAEVPDACFVVVGEEPRQAAGRSSGTRQTIERAAERAGASRSIVLLGSIDDVELAQAYVAADAFVFPVLDLPGDVEGFGMVALEAAAHDTPTVAFSVGGVADAVSPRSGLLVAPGDYAGFAKSVLRILKRQVSELDAASCRRYAADNDWGRFGRQLLNVVDAAIANHRR